MNTVKKITATVMAFIIAAQEARAQRIVQRYQGQWS